MKVALTQPEDVDGQAVQETDGKVIYVGNYTIDIAIKEGVRFVADTGTFHVTTADGSEILVREDSSRAVTTDKNDAEQDLSDLLGSIPTAREKLGGGGRNSLDEAIFMEKSGSGCMYIDMQVPHPTLQEFLSTNGVESYFLNKREAAVNIVIGGGKDKHILKSPIERNKPLTAHEEVFIEDMVRNSRRVMMNSVKDESLAECIMKYAREYDKPVGVVVTTSFDNHDFVKRQIIPNATCIFNYDEIGTVFNPEHKSLGNEDTKYEDALWGLGDAIHIQENSSDGRHSIYVTLGANGVMTADRNGDVYHIHLINKKIQRALNDTIPRREDATNGAGDHFAAAVLEYRENGQGAITAAINAQISAIRFIGYDGNISVSDFQVDPVDKGQLERHYIRRHKDVA